MSLVGTPGSTLRVVIVGAGPAGFYAAEQLLRREGLLVEVDLLDRLPTPFGLVRGGVAPDHQKIKAVTAAFDRVAMLPGFRFFGGVELGKHVEVDDLRRHYHQIVYATGAQTDRRLGIPGEDLPQSQTATEFVAWYNGHPDFRDCTFDLSHERAAVVGVGNVAVDVARMLCRTPAELEKTDIADYALDALRRSRVRVVYLLGRRGPAQAAFTNPEIKELAELADADIVTMPDEVALDELSRVSLERSPDRGAVKKVEILQRYAGRPPGAKSRRLVVRFLVSPTEVLPNAQGEVTAVRLVRNRLQLTPAGTLQAIASGTQEDLPVGLLFRSVGYRGVPLPGVPFDERRGVIPNERGRVLDPHSARPVPGEYTAGWIKRGPTGVIGTNKPDAAETVACMIEDVARGLHLQPVTSSASAAETLMRDRQPRCFSYADWRRLDALEEERGRGLGRPRLKFTRIEDMNAALGR